MFSSFFKQFYYIVIFIIIFTILISVLFSPYIRIDELMQLYDNEQITISEKGFAWPIPGYTNITSYFGKRASPTAGASTYHKGMDIGAPEGTILIATIDGIVSYCGFLGGGGYTITLTNDDMKITYCHVSPNFLVQVGQEIKRGEIIGQVGPKYVYNVKGNTYTDENGIPTNGATTGTHLHIGIRINEEYVDPLNYY